MFTQFCFLLTSSFTPSRDLISNPSTHLSSFNLEFQFLVTSKGHTKSKQQAPSLVNEWLSTNHNASLSRAGSGDILDDNFNAELHFLSKLFTIMASSATMQPPLAFVSTKNPTVNVNINKHLHPLIAPMIYAAIKAEEIINHLHNNNTLKTCSLVYRAWLLPSQYHLFGEFPSQSSWIAPTKLNDFLGIINWEMDNYIEPFIHQVDFYNIDSDYSIYPFVPLLNVLNDETLMPAFKSLHLKHYVLESDDLDHIPLHQLTYLDITKCTFKTLTVWRPYSLNCHVWRNCSLTLWMWHLNTC